MSSSKVSVTYTEQDVELAQLRRLERERAEQERQRLGVAQAEVERQDARYRRLVQQLDEASRRLPDLALQAPPWPAVPASEAGSAQGMARYATQVTALVDGLAQQLPPAIAQAEQLLARRVALAQAWLEATRLQETLSLLGQQLHTAQQALNEVADRPAVPLAPLASATLEQVQDYVRALQAELQAITQAMDAAHGRQAVRRLTQALAGTAVAAGAGAHAALQVYHRQERAQARAALQRYLDQALTLARLSLSALPLGTQALLHNAVVTGENSTAQRAQLARWVAREVVQARHATQARALLQAPPALVLAQPQRTRRWQALQQALEDVMAGRKPWGPHLEQEYQDIRQDAQRDLNTRYALEDRVLALRAQGFEVLYDEAQRLVLDDLHCPGLWLQEVESQAVDGTPGGMANLLELRTDAPPLAPDDEQALIDSVCQRLQAAQPHSTQVQTRHQTAERRPDIRRAQRPQPLRQFRADTP